MATLIVGAVLGFIGTALLQVGQLMAEGRGSWTRRSIAADVALLRSLPKQIRDADAGRALVGRIEDALLAFSGSPDAKQVDADVDDEESVRERAFRREADRLSIRWQGVFTVTAVTVVGMSLVLNPIPYDAGLKFGPVMIAAAVAATAAGVVSGFKFGKAVQALCVRAVRRRWMRDGRTLPERYHELERRTVTPHSREE